MFEKEAEEYRAKRKDCQYFSESYKNRIEKAFKDGAEFGYNKSKAETALLSQHILDLQKDKGNLTDRVRELEAQIKKMKWHKLDWDKAEENPDVDKLVRVRTRSGAEYICETYSYFPAEDEIGYGSVITQFSELNGDWVDDNEIEYWCYIEPFKEVKEND
jgi:hypothetical protein